MELEFYVIHSPELKFRKDNLEKLFALFKEANIVHRCKYITGNEPHEIDRTSLTKIINPNPPTDLPEDSIVKKLHQSFHIRQVSNLMKHVEAIRMISECTPTSTKDKFHIIIEDDVVYPPDIVEQIQKMLSEVKEDDSSVLFLGLPATNTFKEEEKIHDVFSKFNVLPCVDSYVITPQAAKQLYDIIVPFYFPTNIQLTYCMQKIGLKPKFTFPNLFADGSKVGVYTSLLNTNNKLFLNNDYNALLNIARAETMNTETYESAQKIIANAKGIASHPDMAYLSSVIELKMGNIQKSYEMMKKIYELYKTNGSILNHESEFLRMYIDIHKHIDVV
jgi:hypothetical protein